MTENEFLAEFPTDTFISTSHWMGSRPRSWRDVEVGKPSFHLLDVSNYHRYSLNEHLVVLRAIFRKFLLKQGIPGPKPMFLVLSDPKLSDLRNISSILTMKIRVWWMMTVCKNDYFLFSDITDAYWFIVKTWTDFVPVSLWRRVDTRPALSVESAFSV